MRGPRGLGSSSSSSRSSRSSSSSSSSCCTNRRSNCSSSSSSSGSSSAVAAAVEVVACPKELDTVLATVVYEQNPGPKTLKPETRATWLLFRVAGRYRGFPSCPEVQMANHCTANHRRNSRGGSPFITAAPESLNPEPLSLNLNQTSKREFLKILRLSKYGFGFSQQHKSIRRNRIPPIMHPNSCLKPQALNPLNSPKPLNPRTLKPEPLASYLFNRSRRSAPEVQNPLEFRV